mgnify:CR=1 FL=1
MEGQAKLGLLFLIRKRNGFFDIVAKDASKPAVSWLKFEPRVSNFPLIKSDISDFITASTKFFSLIFLSLLTNFRHFYNNKFNVILDCERSFTLWNMNGERTKKIFTK